MLGLLVVGDFDVYPCTYLGGGGVFVFWIKETEAPPGGGCDQSGQWSNPYKGKHKFVLNFKKKRVK